MARPKKIDTSIPIRRNVEEYETALAMYAMGVPGPDLFDDFARNVVRAAVCYAEESAYVAAEVLGEPLSKVQSSLNQMRKEAPSGKTRTRGQCGRGHDLTNPDNVWRRTNGTGRMCKVCYYERRGEQVPTKTSLCKRGHDLDQPDNVWTNEKTGKRQCKKCHDIRKVGYEEKAHTNG